MDLQQITKILKYNEAVAKKFFAIEKKILSILDYTDLFEVLLDEIKEKFQVPYAWISIIDKSEVSGLIQSLENSDNLKKRLNVVTKTTFDALVGSDASPVLINENMQSYDKLLPKKRKYRIKSMAIAPLSLDGTIIGSLNQADTSQKRFQPGIDTSLLEQLAVKVSFCLSNVTAHEKLRYLAYHDPLTGLLNRRVMEAVLDREIRRKKRYPHHLSVVFLDLDKFKQVNDRFGHDCGDDLLVYVADCLMALSRDIDVVSRFAGDEFVMILPETSLKNAQKLMDRIVTHFKSNPLMTPDGTPIFASVSYGIASTEDDTHTSSSSLLKAADLKLYNAKEKRNSHNKKRKSRKKKGSV